MSLGSIMSCRITTYAFLTAYSLDRLLTFTCFPHLGQAVSPPIRAVIFRIPDLPQAVHVYRVFPFSFFVYRYRSGNTSSDSHSLKSTGRIGTLAIRPAILCVLLS